MNPSILDYLTIAMLLVTAGGAAFCVWKLQRQLPARLRRLEEALRIYNGANAAIGSQLAELESAVQALRAGTSGAAPARPMSLRVAESSAAGTDEGEFGEAELRLAQLIKSRLATLRLN